MIAFIDTHRDQFGVEFDCVGLISARGYLRCPQPHTPRRPARALPPTQLAAGACQSYWLTPYQLRGAIRGVYVASLSSSLSQQRRCPSVFACEFDGLP